MYEGWLSFGGNEILNSMRARGIATSADCPVYWLKNRENDCVGLQEALDDADYVHENIDQAPWYSAAEPELSSRFYGAFGIDVTGVDDSTRETAITQLMGDGAGIGRTRKGSREVRIRAWLTARGSDALSYGMSWLSAALDPDACGQHGTGCGATDLEFWSTCPLPQSDFTVPVIEPSPPVTQLLLNPAFEQAATGSVTIRKNMCQNPRPIPGSIAGWSGPTGTASADGWYTITATGTTPYIFTAMADEAINAGDVVTLSAKVKIPAPGVVSYVRAVAHIRSTNAYLSTTNVFAVPAGAGEEFIVSHTLTAAAPYAANDLDLAILPASASGSFLNPPVGWQMAATEVQIERTSFRQAFFDGDTPDALGWDYGWAGTVRNSPSTAKTAAVEVRKNFAWDPRATAAAAFTAGKIGWLARWYGTGGNGTNTFVTGATDGPLGIRTYARKTWTVAGAIGDTGFQHVDAADPATTSLLGQPVTAGQVWTISSYLRATSATPKQAHIEVYFRTAAGTFISTVAQSLVSILGAWTRISYTVTVPPTAVYMAYNSDVDGGTAWAAGDTLDGTGLQVEFLGVLTPYFDAITNPYADDTFSSWTGAANGSPSILSGAALGSYGSNSSAAPYQSAAWSKSGKSMRLTPLVSNGYIDLFTTASTPEAQALRGKTFTIMGTSRATAPLVGGNSGGRRTFNMRTVGASVIFAGVAPISANVAGEETLIQSFTIPDEPGLTQVTLRVYHGGQPGDVDVWWDNLLMVEGSYSSGYFDGSTPDVAPDYEDPGADYAWTGAEHASTSTYTELTLTDAPDTISYAIAIRDSRRFLHEVGAISGPHVLEQAQAGDVYGYLVEIVLVAGKPWVFGATKPVQVPPSLPTVIQDIPYNLVPYPSAELAGAKTITVAKNLSPNPSIETDTTSWLQSYSVTSGSSATPYMTLTRTNGLFSVGSWALQSRILGNGTTAVASSRGLLRAYQDCDLTGYVAGTRFSLNAWMAVVSFMAAASTINNMSVAIEWRSATPAVLRTDTIATTSTPADFGGKVFQAKSILPPAGAVTARIIFTTDVTWQSSSSGTGASNNSDIRQYIDAVALTVP